MYFYSNNVHETCADVQRSDISLVKDTIDAESKAKLNTRTK